MKTLSEENCTKHEKKEHVDGKKSSFCPAKKHCDAPTENIEPCSLLLGQPCASPSKGFEGLADMFGA